MNCDQIIETMAMSLAVGRGRIAAGPREIKEAERALEAVLPMIRAEVLEEAAKVADDAGNTWTGSRCVETAIQEAAVDDKAADIAAAIRAMKGTIHD